MADANPSHTPILHGSDKGPFFHGTGLGGRPVATPPRVFPYLSVAANGSYTAMPGGLALNAPQSGHLQGAATHQGTASKDIWVLAYEPQEHVSLWLQAEHKDEILESSSVLPSRAAENLFWVGRYAERSEGIIRLLRTVLRSTSRVDHLRESADMECLQQLLQALTGLTEIFPRAVTDPGPRLPLDPEQELQTLIGDFNNPGSLATTLQHMIRAAYAVRHLWSTDSWRVINRIEKQWKQIVHVAPAQLPAVSDLDQLIMAMMAFAGLNSESMTREQGWLLLDIGRRIERSLVFCTLLRKTLVGRRQPVIEHLLLEAVLATTENIITYRRRFRSHLHLQTVLEQILLDDANPRSVIYQVNRLQKHIANLPRQRHSHALSAEERMVLGSVHRPQTL